MRSALGFWLTREFWIGPSEEFNWRIWFRRLIPLTFAFSSVVLMTCSDVLFVQAVFQKGQTEYYAAGQTIGVAS